MRSFPLALLLFFIVGCSTSPPQAIKVNSSAHQLSLKDHNDWTIKGKLGFKTSDKKQSANVRWRQNNRQYQLNLTSIIGSSLLTMRGNEEGVSLVADDQTYHDANPTDLIYRVTGWQIPIDELRLWVKGQHNVLDQVLLSEQGWVLELQPYCNQCRAWVITYDNYRLVDDLWLPHKIKLINKAKSSQLLIRVNSWALHD